MATKYVRSYTELSRIPTFEERFAYLRLEGMVGMDTFGSLRFLNQVFYRSKEWRNFRNHIIARDLGCDLGVEGFDIMGQYAVIHHINPLSVEDVMANTELLMDPQNTICTTDSTHKAIHYAKKEIYVNKLVVRKPNDTCPWR